jgi:thymidylate synthase
MLVIEGRNVNTTYPQAISAIRQMGIIAPSRAGDVAVYPSPVMTVTHNPTERVLLEPTRNANPFFHLFESLWMLAGRSDSEYLNNFVRDFGERFAEENGEIWGAYGQRWRDHFEFDQLMFLIGRIKRNPGDRRLVLTMWDPNSDMQYPDVHNVELKDVPCNTHCYFRVINNRLEMTVCCRSNDIIWGAYGANAVHFSILQEFIAGMCGLAVGKMYQMSNNWHAYIDTLDKMGKPSVMDARYLESTPIMENADRWLPDLRNFFVSGGMMDNAGYGNAWFAQVAQPMWRVWRMHREHGATVRAIELCPEIQALDWQMACTEWLQRRLK